MFEIKKNGSVEKRLLARFEVYMNTSRPRAHVVARKKNDIHTAFHR